MSITIRGEGERLVITGDIEGRYNIPFPSASDEFFIACSDGTIIRGRYGEEEVYCFGVAVEGRGLGPSCAGWRKRRAHLGLDRRVAYDQPRRGCGL